MNIREELTQTAGHPDSLDAFVARHPATRALITQLVILLSSDDLKMQLKASGLLKRYTENGARLSLPQLAALFDSLADVQQWEAKLQLCQMLQHVTIPKTSRDKLIWFLDRCLADENKFLRAWAYSGFYELAKQHPAHYDYAMQQLARAEKEKSAAVKARVRHIIKEMDQRGTET